MRRLRSFLMILSISVVCSTAVFAAESIVFDASGFSYVSPWRLQTGKTGALSGNLLVIPPLLEPSEIRLDPQLKGPHRILVGLHHEKTTGADAQYYGPAVMARLDNDSYRLFLSTNKTFAEVEFKIADMTGRSLVLASLSERPAFIDYVRFEPVAPVPYQVYEQKRLAPHQKDVVGISDTNVWMWRYTSRSEQDFRDIVGQHQWAGFNRIYWMANAGALFYHTEVGTRFRGDKRPHTLRSGYMVENFRPLESGVKYSHEMGLELWGWYRLNNNFASQHDLEAYGTGLNSEFFMSHPEFRLIRADGRADPSKYSFAYPEVRAYVRAICIEMVRKGVDGLMFDLLRHPPLAGYEPPLVEGYIKQYGVDPRTIPTGDTESYTRWTTYRARHSFTQFVIELKAELARLQLDVPFGIRCSLAPFDWNREQGMDVEDLVAQGLVKEICLMQNYLGKPELTFSPREIAAASAPYLNLRQGRDIRLICGLHGRGPGETLEYARFIHEAGYDGVAIYESNILLNQTQYLTAFQKLKFKQTIDTPWVTASSSKGDQLVPWQPALDRPGEWWQLNLPRTDRLIRLALRFDRNLDSPPTVSFSEDDSLWHPSAKMLKPGQDGWLVLELEQKFRQLRVTLPESAQLLNAHLDLADSGNIRIGEVRNDEIQITSPSDGSEVAPGVVFEAKLKGSPQTSQVEFFWDGILIRTEREAPYTWFTDATLRPGTHTLKVRRVDHPLAPAVDEITIRVKGDQAALMPLPTGARPITAEDFETLPEGSSELPEGWFFAKGLDESYTRGKPKGSVRVEQIGGSRALRMQWSGEGPRMYVNVGFGGPVPKGMVEFDVLVPDAKNQRLAGLFEGPILNLAMYLVDKNGKMTYNSGRNSHQDYAPPVPVTPGIWRHVKWEWDAASSSQTIYIDDMKSPLIEKSGVRISPKTGIDRFGFFFFENQSAEILIDNFRAVEYPD